MLNYSVDKLSIEEKVGQLFVIGIAGPEVDSAALNLIEYVRPGGMCLFARNIRTAVQTRALADDLFARLPIPPILAVDQEGGLVDRLRRILTPMPAAAAIKTADQASEFGLIVGEVLLNLGFNLNFAPVVDVTGGRGQSSNGIYSRGFGENADAAAELAGAFLIAMQSTGCLGCLKHFPGLGASMVDSHERLPLVEISESEFTAIDLAPFRALSATAASIMVAHAAYPMSNLQETRQDGKLLPSSLSRTFVSRLLRQKLNFGGLIVSDDLEMGAIVNDFGISEACRLGIEAGVDVLSVCADADRIRDGFDAVIQAVRANRITEERISESVQRVLALKERFVARTPFDAHRHDELSERVERLKARLT